MHPTKVKNTNIQKDKKEYINTNMKYKKYTIPKIIQNAQSYQSAYCGRVFCAPNFPSLKGGAVKCQIICTWLRGHHQMWYFTTHLILRKQQQLDVQWYAGIHKDSAMIRV